MFVTASVSRFVSLALAFAFSWAGPARAGSFLMDTGGWQVITSTTFMTSSLAYDANGALTPASQYRKIETGVLMEYGLSRNVTLVLNPVARDISAEGQAGPMTGHGLTSFEAGARWRLFDYDGQAVSFQATTRIPAKSDPILLYENRPRTELRLGYGTPAIINRKPGFIDGSIAWVKRHEPGVDEVKIDMTYGWWQRRDRMVLFQYFTTLYPGAGLRHDPRQHKIQTSTVYKLNDQWSFQLGSFFTRGGHLTRRERGTIMAVWRRF
jgi:hypothetical protein